MWAYWSFYVLSEKRNATLSKRGLYETGHSDFEQMDIFRKSLVFLATLSSAHTQTDAVLVLFLK